jgi:outer membrane protein assembly factor BamB
MANMKLFAFDARTGKELWRNSPNDWQNGGSTPVVFKIGGESAILECRYLHRASDGTVICPSNLSAWGVLTPIAENGMMFVPSQFQGWETPLTFVAVRAPASAAAGGKAALAWKPPAVDVAMPVRGTDFYIASPLYVNGVVYSVNVGGGLTAVDVSAQKGLYHLWLDGYTRYNRYVYGIAASPTLAGKHIYITDDAGFTHVIQPGPDFKQVAGNVLENLHLSGQGGNPCRQESFYTSPVFAGQAMYLRGEEYLYCIGPENR